jgi:hypothetical protein
MRMTLKPAWSGALLLLFSGFALAQQQPLKIEVAMEVGARLRGPNEIAVAIVNAGNAPVTLPIAPSWDTAGGLELSVTQVNGPTRTIAVSRQPRAHSASTGGQRVPLPAGHSIVVFRQVSGRELFFAGPGQYRLTVAFKGLAQSVQSPPLLVTVK